MTKAERGNRGCSHSRRWEGTRARGCSHTDGLHWQTVWTRPRWFWLPSNHSLQKFSAMVQEVAKARQTFQVNYLDTVAPFCKGEHLPSSNISVPGQMDSVPEWLQQYWSYQLAPNPHFSCPQLKHFFYYIYLHLPNQLQETRTAPKRINKADKSLWHITSEKNDKCTFQNIENIHSWINYLQLPGLIPGHITILKLYTELKQVKYTQ